MVKVKLYVEGTGNDRQRAIFREAFRDFFAAAGVTKRPGTVPCGSRQEAYESFVAAVRERNPGVLPLLLVDSEKVVDPTDDVWQHLKKCDKWDRPQGASDDQAFLMVQIMETWFLADVENLRKYFGSRFKVESLEKWPKLEAVDKDKVIEALKKATSGCKKPYSKREHSFDLIGRIRPSFVERASPHAKSLLDRLREG